MLDKIDYSKLTLEELLIEETKLKKNETLSALLIGVAIGIIVYGVAKNGMGGIYVFLPLFLIYGIYKNSQKNKKKLKEIHTEIALKESK